ncbi:MAG: DUF2232 domain-containing protein [Thermodesulfobacteriota bacterium]
MADSAGGSIPRLNINPLGLLIVFAVWIMPIISLEFIWLQFFAPLPVFYYLVKSETGLGINTLAAALLLTGIIATATGAANAFFFTATMLPAGYLLARGAAEGNSPLQAGLKAFIALLLGWGLWMLLYGIVYNANLYQEILSSLDQGLLAAGKAFMESSELPAEHALALETTISRLRSLVPHIMPGLLLATMLNTVFFNMIFGLWLLKKSAGRSTDWPLFTTWQLPEQLVTAVIIAGALILLSDGPLRDIGLNVIILTGTLYLFQGLAVLGFLLNKWQVPTPLRILIFLLIVFQAYGVIILAVFGLADVWADFRKEKTGAVNDDDVNMDNEQ